MRSVRGLVLVSFAAVMVFGSDGAHAQEDPWCEGPGQGSGTALCNVPAGEYLPATGTVNALVVLFRFSDENRASLDDGWPINPAATNKDALPAWADSLIEDPTGDPVVDGSLTYLFHHMSQGDLSFRGTVYDSVVVLPPVSSFTSAWDGATAAIDSIDTWGFDLSPYVNNVTNHLDYVAFVYRGGRKYEALTDAAGACSLQADCRAFKQVAHASFPATGQTGHLTHTLPSSGYEIDPYLSSMAQGIAFWVPYADYPTGVEHQAGTLEARGDCAACAPEGGGGSVAGGLWPIMDHSLRGYSRVLAHEMGHSLYRNNDLLCNANHIYSMGNWDIMISNGHGGIMCGAARHLVGWGNAIEIAHGEQASLTLYDSTVEGAPSFTSARSDSVLAVVYAAPDSSQYFVLENRRASTSYAEPYEGASGFTVDGQPGSGLLITHVTTDGVSWSGGCAAPVTRRWRLSVKAAGGMWDDASSPDPVEGRDSISRWGKPSGGGTSNYYCQLNGSDASDTFGPHSSTMITPYTTPSTRLFGEDADFHRLTVDCGLSILNIAEGPDSSVSFDVVWDQPENATDGNVVWRDRVILSDDFTVEVGDTVFVAEGAKIMVRGDGGVLRDEGADDDRVELIVEGVMKGENPLEDGVREIASAFETSLRVGPYADSSAVSAEADWYGVRLPRGGELLPFEGEFRDALYAVAFEDTLFPYLGGFGSGTNKIDLIGNEFEFGFDRDVVIPQEDSVVLKSGWDLGFGTKGTDQEDIGDYSNLVELIIEGQFWFQGQSFYDRVSLRSALFPYDSGSAKGSWGGVRLDAYPPSGGTCAGSRVWDFTEVEDAKVGVAVLDSCAAVFNWPLFENNEDADIYFDRDICVSYGKQWDLRAPTRVVVEADSSAWDLPDGESGVADLIVNGTLIAKRPGVLPSGVVTFETTAMDSVNGDDWGGITVTYTGKGVIEEADIGFARHPVFFAAADSAVLEDTRIHHYSEVGVLDWGSDAQISRCEIERGEDLAVDVSAIRSNQSASRIVDNRIGFQTDYGIWAGTTSGYCTTPLSPGSPDTLLIQGNHLEGDGPGNRTGSAGIYGEWLCHDFVTVIDADTVSAWKGRGLHLHQAADVEVSCSEFGDNRHGVRYFRDTAKLDSTEGFVQFDGNGIRSSYLYNFDVEGLAGLMVYDRSGAGTLAENNSLQLAASGGKNFKVSYAGADPIDAGAISWLLSDGTAMTDSATIQATNAVGIADVLLSPILTGEEVCSGGSSAAEADLEVAVVSDDVLGAGGVRKAQPEWQWSVSAANPASIRDGVAVSLSVPRNVDALQVQVYDVSGRRVRRVWSGAVEGGLHALFWNCRDEEGRAVAPGVYFMRIEATGYERTQKLTLVR